MTTSQLLRLPSRRATHQTMASQLDFKLISAATAIDIIASTQHFSKLTTSAVSTIKHIETGNHIAISLTPSSKPYNSTMHWQFSSLRFGTLQWKISISRLTKSEFFGVERMQNNSCNRIRSPVKRSGYWGRFWLRILGGKRGRKLMRVQTPSYGRASWVVGGLGREAFN